MWYVLIWQVSSLNWFDYLLISLKISFKRKEKFLQDRKQNYHCCCEVWDNIDPFLDALPWLLLGEILYSILHPSIRCCIFATIQSVKGFCRIPSWWRAGLTYLEPAVGRRWTQNSRNKALTTAGAQTTVSILSTKFLLSRNTQRLVIKFGSTISWWVVCVVRVFVCVCESCVCVCVCLCVVRE